MDYELMWKGIIYYDQIVKDILSTVDKKEEPSDFLKELIQKVDKQQEEWISSFGQGNKDFTFIKDPYGKVLISSVIGYGTPKIKIEKKIKTPEYTKLEEYITYDKNNLYCVDMFNELKGKTNSSTFLKAYNSGHRYVFDIDFMEELTGKDLYWDLIDEIPYECNAQFSYGAAQAVGRFIDECKQGIHQKPGSMEDILNSYSLDVDLETETKELIWDEIGEELYDLLYYED
jgi:hypothetical protein